MVLISTPTWQSATAGSLPQASQVNQLLGTHTSTTVMTGTQTVIFSGGTGNINSNAQYMAQTFTSAVGQTTLGYVAIQIVPTVGTGATLSPMNVSLYANSAGAPTGSALVTTTVTAEYTNSAPLDVIVPLPYNSLVASTQYWIVTTPTNNGAQHYSWNKSSQVSGCSTSANGTTWAAQAFGLRIQVFDRTALSPVVAQWDDNGARWVWTNYTNFGGKLSQLAEYTAGQTTAGYTQSFRNLFYTTGLLTGAS